MNFAVTKKSKKSRARLSVLKTAHGKISGPFFMPIATKAAVKNVTTDDIHFLQSEILLSNTYHLFLAPGTKIIKKAGGLHKFMNWDGPILTDSGGFQVFSLSKIRKISENGVVFAEPKSGKKNLLTPEKSMQIQLDLGVDIAMSFDDVIGYPATKKAVEESMHRTHRWAVRCKQYHQKKNTFCQLLFGIVQGGIHEDLRKQSAQMITQIGFDGYAIGGVAVGEPREVMTDILNWTVPILDEAKPRYLMGLGKPEEIVSAVKQGVDMFDCVIPTREARHGRLYLFTGKDINKKNFYTTINISNSKFSKNFESINPIILPNYSKAYLHHLFKTKEMLGMHFATLNNLYFYLELMRKIRKAISNGSI